MRKPPGAYDQLVTNSVSASLVGTDAATVEALPASRAAGVLAWHVYERVFSLLSDITGQDAATRQLHLANQVLQTLPKPDSGDDVAATACRAGRLQWDRAHVEVR